MGKVLTSVVTRYIYGLVLNDSHSGLTVEWYETRADAVRAGKLRYGNSNIISMPLRKNTWNQDEARDWPEYDR